MLSGPARLRPRHPQVADSIPVVAQTPEAVRSCPVADSGGIIRHPAARCGEQCDADAVGWDQAAAAAAGPPESTLLVGRRSPEASLSHPTLNEIPARPVRRGRPLALDDLAKGRLLGLMSYGLSFRQAAAQVGVHHQTILNLMKRDDEFAQQVSEARLDAISQPVCTIVRASRKSWRAAAWLAKYLEERRVRSYETTPEEHAVEKLRDRR